MKPELLGMTDTDGVINVDIRVCGEDIAEAFLESHSCFEMQAKQTFLGGCDAEVDLQRFEVEYTLSKAVNLVIANLGVDAIASSHITSTGVVQAGESHLFSATIYPRPEAHLSTYEPVDLRQRRVVAPGSPLSSAVSPCESLEDIKYVDEGHILMIELLNRLVCEIPSDVLNRVVQEYGTSYSWNLKSQGSSIEKYCGQMNINEQSFSSFMTVQAIKRLREELALDALFKGIGLVIDDSDIDKVFEGLSEDETRQAREAYELHGDTYILLNAARQRKALSWLFDTAICC